MDALTVQRDRLRVCALMKAAGDPLLRRQGALGGGRRRQRLGLGLGLDDQDALRAGAAVAVRIGEARRGQRTALPDRCLYRPRPGRADHIHRQGQTAGREADTCDLQGCRGRTGTAGFAWRGTPTEAAPLFSVRAIQRGALPPRTSPPEQACVRHGGPVQRLRAAAAASRVLKRSGRPVRRRRTSTPATSTTPARPLSDDHHDERGVAGRPGGRPKATFAQFGAVGAGGDDGGVVAVG